MKSAHLIGILLIRRVCWRVGRVEPVEWVHSDERWSPAALGRRLKAGLVHNRSTTRELQRERAGLRETGGPPVRTMFALASGRNR